LIFDSCKIVAGSSLIIAVSVFRFFINPSATAQDNRSDALVSIGAFVGIIGTQFGWSWLDPIAAFIVGIIICKTAFQIFRDASHALTDGFDEKELKRFKKTIESTPGVNKLQDIKARIHGNNVLLDVTIQVNSSLSVVQSHDISDATDAPKSLSSSRYTFMLDLRTLKKPTHYERTLQKAT
jgi:cation diffusion facilitator family transporter